MKNSTTYNSLKESKVYSTLFKHKLDNGGLSISSVHNRDKVSEVNIYVWGSNSSYQLGETGLDRMMLPKLATSFSDVDSVSYRVLTAIIIWLQFH